MLDGGCQALKLIPLLDQGSGVEALKALVEWSLGWWWPKCDKLLMKNISDAGSELEAKEFT